MKKLELEQLANRLIEIAETLKNLNNNTDITSPVTDFTELTELLKAEVIKRIGNGKPIGVRDVVEDEWEECLYWKKDEVKELGKDWYYNEEIDTLYNNSDTGRTIVYENGVFATVQDEDKGAVLIEQAKKMGFKEGVKGNFPKTYIDLVDNLKETDNFCKSGWTYEEDFDILFAGDVGGLPVYCRGEWATIIQEPIIIDGKEVEIEKNQSRINGILFGAIELRCFQSLNPIFTEILKRMEEKNGGKE